MSYIVFELSETFKPSVITLTSSKDTMLHEYPKNYLYSEDNLFSI